MAGPLLLLLPGNGIRPEVIALVRRVIDRMRLHAGLRVNVEERPLGGASYELCGEPLSADTCSLALTSEAVLMGAAGGPQWDTVAREKRPEAGLLNLRRAMDVYANIRPIHCFEALADASSLKRHLVAGLETVIVRELTSGIYFGDKGIDNCGPGGERRAFDRQQYTESEIRRVSPKGRLTWRAAGLFA